MGPCSWKPMGSTFPVNVASCTDWTFWSPQSKAAVFTSNEMIPLYFSWSLLWSPFMLCADPSPGLTTVTRWGGFCCLTSPIAAPSRTSTTGWRRPAATFSHTASSSYWLATSVTWRPNARWVLWKHEREEFRVRPRRAVATDTRDSSNCWVLKRTLCSRLDQKRVVTSCFKSLGTRGGQEAKISPVKMRHYRMTLQNAAQREGCKAEKAAPHKQRAVMMVFVSVWAKA